MLRKKKWVAAILSAAIVISSLLPMNGFKANASYTLPEESITYDFTDSNFYTENAQTHVKNNCNY